MDEKIHRFPERNFGIDLLRIISMLMIVMLHVLGCGGVLGSATDFWRSGIAWSFEIAAYCAVNCYALISGYVGINSKHKPYSLINLWIQVAFYSITIAVFMFLIRPEIISIKGIIPFFLPVTFEKYWYFTAYFAMWFFIPVMNAAINNISKVKMGMLLIASFILTTPSNLLVGGVDLSGGYSPAWLFFLYLIGAYLKKHDILKKISPKISLFIYFVCIGITMALKLSSPFINRFGSVIGTFDDILINYSSPTILVAGISLLALFTNLKISQGFTKIISFFAPLSFSVYLIHTHPLIFSYVFKDAFAFWNDQHIVIMILGLLASVFIVYILCTLIDYFRVLLFRVCKIKEFSLFVEKKLICYTKKICSNFNK